MKGREEQKEQERIRREKKEKIKRELIECMELERKLIRAGAQSQYGELAGRKILQEKKEQEKKKGFGLLRKEAEKFVGTKLKSRWTVLKQAKRKNGN